MFEEENKDEYLAGDVVRLNPANVVLNDFHYGEIPNVEGLENGIVISTQYSRQAGQMSYLVEFGEKEYWFLGHEIY